MHFQNRFVSCVLIVSNLFIQVNLGLAKELDDSFPGILHEDGHLHSIFPDLGEEVAVNFVTNVRNRRDLSAQTHHIVNFQLASMSKPVSLHLAKDSMSIVMKEDSKVWTEEFDCLYSGVVSEREGSAALSTCSVTHGFTGHLVMDSTHYTIEPAPQTLTKAHQETFGSNASESEPHTVLHRVYRSAQIIEQQNKTVSSDCLQAPSDLLQEALSAVPESATQDDDSPITSLSDDATGPSSVLVDKKSKKASGKFPKKAVDMALFLDRTLINTWTSKYPKDGKNRLKLFVINVLSNMNLLYQQPSLKQAVDVSLRLVHIEFLSTTPLELHDTDDVDIYISSFCKWMSSKNTKGTKWDHALMLSGHDLISQGNSAVAGVAYFSTICLDTLSCSVGEGSDFGTSFIMTHEIGHSLGMSHDGSSEDGGVSKSCDGSKYIMSPTTGPGKSIWSKCSGKNAQHLLSNGIEDMRSKKMITGHLKCLDQPSSLKSAKIDFNKRKGKLPGEVFDANAQCLLACGTKHQCTSYKKDSTVCRDVQCAYQQGTSMYVRGSHSALEGTSCGNGKWCRNQNCVAKKNAG